MEKRVLAIVGPTASGKSKLGIQLALKLNTEIISADSRQIYKELTIGTAKPSDEELKLVKHHFINHKSITEKYDVGKFYEEATEVINTLHNQNKIPIVVGGSGLYINSLLYGIFEGPSSDNQIRNLLEEELRNNGINSLLEKLKKVDITTYERIDKKNPRRIIRALEVYYSTGKPISELQKEKHRKPDFVSILFGLKWDRQKLYDRINYRVDLMIKNGLVEEVKKVLDKYGENVNVVLQTVGYKEVIQFLRNELTFERMIELIKQNTRRYAKRQMTWYRKNKNIIWLDVYDESDFEKLTKMILETISGGNR